MVSYRPQKQAPINKPATHRNRTSATISIYLHKDLPTTNLVPSFQFNLCLFTSSPPTPHPQCHRSIYPSGARVRGPSPSTAHAPSLQAPRLRGAVPQSDNAVRGYGSRIQARADRRVCEPCLVQRRSLFCSRRGDYKRWSGLDIHILEERVFEKKVGHINRLEEVEILADMKCNFS